MKSMKDVAMSSWKVYVVVSQSTMVAEDRFLHMMWLFSYFVQNPYYIIKIWHCFLYHESSYVWDLILGHIWFMPRFVLKSGCDIQWETPWPSYANIPWQNSTTSPPILLGSTTTSHCHPVLAVFRPSLTTICLSMTSESRQEGGGVNMRNLKFTTLNTHYKSGSTLELKSSPGERVKTNQMRIERMNTMICFTEVRF
jgi:hypothetical protein